MICDKNKCVMIGSGGHARVIQDILEESAPECFFGYVDVIKSDQATMLAYLGNDEILPKLVEQGVTHFVLGIGSINKPLNRADVFERLCKLGLNPFEVIHPSALVSHHASLGLGCQLMIRSVVSTKAQLGRNVLINTGAIVEHDCEVGDHVHVATGAILCGQVIVGHHTHIGAGAIVRQGITIGSHALIAAGAVVVTNVPNGASFRGVPARIIESQEEKFN